jgi:hypothetical protein
MSVFERSQSGTVRSRLREFIKTFSGEPPTPEENRARLEFLQRTRKELAAGHGDLLRLLAPGAAADALGDVERIAAYAETFAVEAMLSESAGLGERARALRRQAILFAEEARRRARAPDSELEALIANEGRLNSTQPDRDP